MILNHEQIARINRSVAEHLLTEFEQKNVLDTIADLERRLTEAEERVTLERTAALRQAIEKFNGQICCDYNTPEPHTSCNVLNEAVSDLESMIDPSDASLYEHKLAEARQAERDRCAIEVYKAYKAGNGELQRVAAMAANNIRALGPMCATCGGRGAIRWKEPNLECSKPCPDCTQILAELRRVTEPKQQAEERR